MSLIQLRSFMEVIRCQSLSAAAQALGLTQPAVSQHVASLEAQIGRALFDRHSRGMRPTATALDLARDIGTSLDQAEAAMAMARARSTQLSGTIHIAGPAEYLTEGSPEQLIRLQQAGLALRIHPGGRDAIYDLLLADEVDLAVTASTPPDARLDYRRLTEERLLLVAAPALARMLRPDRLAEDLAAAPCLAYDLERPLIREWLRENALSLSGNTTALTAPDLRMLRELVCRNAGWTVLPDYLCREAVAEGRLQIIPAPVREPRNDLNLVWSRSALRHPRVAHARRVLLEG